MRVKNRMTPNPIVANPKTNFNKALRLMQQADVVVYDRLVAKPILDMVRRDAKRIYVGKERGNHAMRQEEINRLLADLEKIERSAMRLASLLEDLLAPAARAALV